MTAPGSRITARFIVAKDNRGKIEELQSKLVRDAGDDGFEATWDADGSAITFKAEGANGAALADVVQRVGAHFEFVEQHATLSSLECAGDVPEYLLAGLRPMGAVLVRM